MSAGRPLLALVTTVALCVLALGAGLYGGFAVALLVIAGFALLMAIAALWASLEALSGNAPMSVDDALALAHPTAIDERKRETLQALKELEFDFGVGKIAGADYENLVHRYRSEAKLLLRSSEESSEPVRARAAAYVAKLSAEHVLDHACAACGAVNDQDAVFCKKCGSRLSAPVGTGDDR